MGTEPEPLCSVICGSDFKVRHKPTHNTTKPLYCLIAISGKR